MCGVAGELHWIHGELVDTGSTCPACLAGGGTAPPLEGTDSGSV